MNANASVAKKTARKMLKHSLLRVLGADFHHLLAVRYRCLLRAFEFNVRLDELDRAVSSGGDGLRGSAREPVDHCPAADQPQHEGRVQQREVSAR